MGQEQRRLAAILAADVVGYSRLMAADETGTLARFRQLRSNVIDPAIAQFQGHVVGTAGDSLLVEFNNALAAVECAIACQRELSRINAPEAEDRRIVFRMGVNLGDVIAADDTIHGDGVNVASRLEKLAEPGGLCVARNVFEQIEGKVDLTFTDLGEQQFKNIAKPIRVYRADMANTAKPAAAPGVGIREPTRSEKVAIAVLPFDNMSGDLEQGYFSDAITDDIITELSRFREFLVIARNSSFQFRGKGVDIKEVAQKLGVQFVVEGSVRKAGNRVRVTAQLIDATSTAHVWAERYDRDLTDVFDIQDEITRTITTQVAGQTRSNVVDRIRSRPTESLSAYDNFLRARAFFQSDTTALQAEPFLRKAIQLDPQFADAHALMSVLHTLKYFYNLQSYDQSQYLADALAFGQRALDLDPSGPMANHAMGFASLYLRRADEAGHYLRRAISLNPNEIFYRGDYACWIGFKGDIEGALREIEEALRRDPYGQDWFWDVRGRLETTAGRYADALGSYHRMKSQSPWSQCYQAICHMELGQVTEAKACLERFRAAIPGAMPADYLADVPFDNSAPAKRLIDAIHRVEAVEVSK